ncbi:hypothetical protein JYQ62_20725 [Nostoc sp. UHCC 0702]|nr:hypothetical protein JYQ62_20725 [Nostoc sp. UHCC 0702]
MCSLICRGLGTGDWGLGTGDWGHFDHAVVERSRNSVHRPLKSLCLEKFRSAEAAAPTFRFVSRFYHLLMS